MSWSDHRQTMKDKLDKLREIHRKLRELDREFRDHVQECTEAPAAFNKYDEWYHLEKEELQLSDDIAEYYRDHFGGPSSSIV